MRGIMLNNLVRMESSWKKSSTKQDDYSKFRNNRDQQYG